MGTSVPWAVPRTIRWLLAACVALLVVAWWQRDWLGDRLFPAARAQVLERRAQHALEAGRLTRGDGEGARELFEAAIAIDPDRLAPRQGLARVAAQALADAERDIGAGRLAQARRALALAVALEAPRDRVSIISERLRRQEAVHLRTGDLLQQADRARREGRLDGAVDAALPLYAQVLATDPRNLLALRGREDALDDLLALALQALANGRVAEAAARIDTARAHDPGHEALPAAEDALQQALDASHRPAQRDAGARERPAGTPEVRKGKLARGVEIPARPMPGPRRAEDLRPVVPLESVLQRARAARAAGRLTSPAGDNALQWLRQAQSRAPREARVRSETGLLDEALQRCHATALQRNALARADACLQGRIALAGADAGFGDVRRRHAARWLAVAEERLRGGDVAGARRAWASARRQDVGLPGLRLFARRLRAAERAR